MSPTGYWRKNVCKSEKNKISKMLKTLCSNVGIFLVLKIGEYSDLAILVSGMEGNSFGSN